YAQRAACPDRQRHNWTEPFARREDVGGGQTRLGATAHCDPYSRCAQRSGVVYAVAHHVYVTPLALRFDERQLLLRGLLASHDLEGSAGRCHYTLHDLVAIARENSQLIAHSVQGP